MYEKEFSVPQEYEDFRVVFEFEGVYRNAEVYLNGKRAGFRPYGYTNFYVEANEFLHFGMKNQIQGPAPTSIKIEFGFNISLAIEIALISCFVIGNSV